jgi:hypothetical protein
MKLNIIAMFGDDYKKYDVFVEFVLIPYVERMPMSIGFSRKALKTGQS